MNPPLACTEDQIAELLRHARLIEDDAKRDAYFAEVADILRGMPTVDDSAVRLAAGVAFEPFKLVRDTSQ